VSDQIRSLLTVSDDGLYPGNAFMLDPELEGMRCLAAAYVLCRIPEGDYQKLRGAADSFQWYLPGADTLGEVMPFPVNVRPRARKGKLALAPYAQVVYLAPGLERVAWPVAVAVVAHELAHIVLGHDLHAQPDVYDRQEQEAFDRLCAWGFGQEAKAHRRRCLARDARRERESERLQEDVAIFMANAKK
jgi:hypothetical protein